ncbi:hypothetical protein SAMN05421687_11140 [Salimicrobium flavidum]|uniref:Uncharacterized protein n=1 Tax=Salimicrobium flavidum TaxID=570947 RepID=A0A1N7KG75_9BACI|nr:hypothetical protein SAMN05421687_11140 [Salimicrobium flavidum]
MYRLPDQGERIFPHANEVWNMHNAYTVGGGMRGIQKETLVQEDPATA